MSDIKVGDLVQIVRAGRCGCGASIGHIFTVRAIVRQVNRGYCVYCMVRFDSCGDMVTVNDKGNRCELWRLKKIPPLSELERVTEKEELTA